MWRDAPPRVDDNLIAASPPPGLQGRSPAQSTQCVIPPHLHDCFRCYTFAAICGRIQARYFLA
eukprot:5636474-Pleurochrysis_carterae.AAC.1